MRRRQEQYGNGKTLAQRLAGYVETWEGRCYADGIPDEVPAKLAASGRAPSYKQIAVAILRNDHTLKSLGFAQSDSELSAAVFSMNSPQRRLL